MKKAVRISGILMAILIFVSGVALYILTYHVLPYSPIRPHRCTREEIAKYLPRGSTPMDLGLTAERFDVAVEDTIALKGWFIHASTLDPQGTVILLHGSAGCKEGMLTTAARFSEDGLNTIVFDLRAHGESGGMFCAFGYFEKRD